MYVNKYGGITFVNKKEVSDYFAKKIEPEFNRKQDEAIEKYNSTLDAEIAKAQQQAAKRAVTLLIPVISTSLYEIYGFGEEKQDKVIKRVAELMSECTKENIFEWEEYKEFCEKRGKKCFVEAENE